MKADFFNGLIASLKGKLSKEDYSFGLNLGVSSIKLAKLRFAKDEVELCGFSIDQTELDMESVLKKIVRDQGVSKVNISVSGQQAITRYIDFPKMSQHEMKQALKFEAQKYIPFPVAEVNIDGFILRDDLPDNKMRVLLAAVKKEFLNPKIKLLKDLGIDIGVVDIDSLGLINAFNFNYSEEQELKNKTIALLNIGSATSNLNILESGMPSLSRDINLGGNNFTQRVADALATDFKTAEGLKTNSERQKNDKVAAAVEAVLMKLAQEVRTSFDYYESRSVSSVEKIYLSGGGSLYDGLKDMLSDLLAINVDNWDPFKKIKISDSLDSIKVRSLAGQLTVAVGLALRAV